MITAFLIGALLFLAAFMINIYIIHGTALLSV